MNLRGNWDDLIFFFFFFFLLSLWCDFSERQTDSGKSEPDDVQNVLNLLHGGAADTPVLYCSQYHWLPHGGESGKGGWTCWTLLVLADTPELLPAGVSERQVWRGFSFFWVPLKIVPELGGHAAREVKCRKPETWDQFFSFIFFFYFFFFCFLIIIFLRLSRLSVLSVLTVRKPHIAESQCQKTRITFLFVWVDVPI